MSSLGYNRRQALSFALALGLLGSGSANVAAQEKPACEQFDWSVKREQPLFGSSDLKKVPSGTALDTLPDRGIALELQPHAAVAFVLPPERQPKIADSFSGFVSVSNVPKAGSYEVTTSGEAWFDVIQNGKAVASTAHTGRRDCSDVRKSVRFNLVPGPVTLQFSGAASNLIKLAVLSAE